MNDVNLNGLQASGINRGGVQSTAFYSPNRHTPQPFFFSSGKIKKFLVFIREEIIKMKFLDWTAFQQVKGNVAPRKSCCFEYATCFAGLTQGEKSISN